MNRVLATAGAVALLAGVQGGVAAAGGATNFHVKRHLRVDGSSDLRGLVTARSGLHATNGITTDTLTTTGPVQLGGVLTVAGQVTSAGLNAGAGAVTTAGALQGGSLTVTGDAAVGGNLAVTRALSASGASFGAAGVQVAGPLSAASASVGGQLNAASASIGGQISAANIITSGGVSAGSLSAGSASFSRLAVTPGGTVDFGNATVSGLNLGGNLAVSSLQITTPSSGGSGGTPALTLNQAGQVARVSVSSSDVLTVAAAGLSAQAMTVSGDTTLGGKLTVSRIASSSGLTLDAPNVATTGNLNLGNGGDLTLGVQGNGASHIVGSRDVRGTCSASGSTDGTNSCQVSFVSPYGSAPIVVATPATSDPTLVTRYSVQSSSGGFTIYFTLSRAGSASFYYQVVG